MTAENFNVESKKEMAIIIVSLIVIGVIAWIFLDRYPEYHSEILLCVGCACVALLFITAYVKGKVKAKKQNEHHRLSK